MRPVRVALEAVGVVAVLAFVAAVAYLPHADSFSHAPPDGPSIEQLARVYQAWLVDGTTDDYRYTVHVDENVHWVASANTARAGTLRNDGIFYSLGEDATPLSLRGLVHERGFHVGLVMFQGLTGLDWLDVFRFLPAAWMGVIALVLWAGLRPWAGALPAAALVALIPTSARFLGPGFLVPAGFGLAWLAALMVLLPRLAREGRYGGLLVLLLAWAFFIHLIAGAAVMLLVLCALPLARGNRRGLAVLAALAALPALALAEVFTSDVNQELARTQFLPIDFTVFDQLGIPFLALWVLGCALVVLRPPRAEAAMPVALAALGSIVILGFMLTNLSGAMRLYALYDRWHQPFALLAILPVVHALVSLGEATVAAVTIALAALRRQLVRGGMAPARPGRARPGARTAALAVAMLVLLTAATDEGLGQHLDEPYYHVMDDRTWAAYTWAAANANDTYEVFLGEPWAAVMFAALSGKTPHTYLSPGFPPIRGGDWTAYLQGMRGDGAWLVEREVSLVVGPVLPTAPEFESAGPDSAWLEWAYAQELAAIRAEARR